MCVIDLEPCEVWSEKERTARKAHSCSCCGSAIHPGQRYLDHFSVYDGSATLQKACLPCRDDRKEFADEHDGMICNPGYFMEMLGDCITDEEPESDAKWSPMLDRITSRRAMAEEKRR